MEQFETIRAILVAFSGNSNFQEMPGGNVLFMDEKNLMPTGKKM
jgi:hypothetical protein